MGEGLLGEGIRGRSYMGGATNSTNQTHFYVDKNTTDKLTKDYNKTNQMIQSPNIQKQNQLFFQLFLKVKTLKNGCRVIINKIISFSRIMFRNNDIIFIK